MKSEEIAGKLDRLSELKATGLVVVKELEEKKKKVVERLQPKLDALEKQYAPILVKAAEAIVAAENEVRREVLALKESVKGKTLLAVYMKGRVTWDGKGLDGFAVAHPEIKTFGKEGEPSVSIREGKTDGG